MAVIPAPMNTTAAAIYALHERRRDETPRAYLGASELGESCARRLWLRFRWVEVEAFEGRMLRLFDTGSREEARVLQELRDIGCRVEGTQHEVEACGGHLKGHMDAAVLGLVEAPATWHVVDVKTAKASKFAEMQKKGAGEVYPKYAAQLMLYMGLTGMERAAFFLVCKDTDEIAVERLLFVRPEFDRLLARAASIIFAAEPPPKISTDPTWFECRFCPFHQHCHGTQAPLVNCRTCAHSTPLEDGSWHCAHHDATIPEDVQRDGCVEHRPHPALVESFLALEGSEGNVVRWRNKLTGGLVQQPEYSSLELRNATDKAFLGSEFVAMMKGRFPGTKVVPSAPKLSWQTFRNGTRHIRSERPGHQATYLPQTPENLAAIAAQGNREYSGQPPEIEDDLPWINADESNRASGSANSAAKPRGGARRGSRRVSDVPPVAGKPL